MARLASVFGGVFCASHLKQKKNRRGLEECRRNSRKTCIDLHTLNIRIYITNFFYLPPLLTFFLFL